LIKNCGTDTNKSYLISDHTILTHLVWLQSEQWIGETTLLLNNTNSQSLSCRDVDQLSDLQKNLSDFQSTQVPVQKEKLNQMVTLSVQLYG